MLCIGLFCFEQSPSSYIEKLHIIHVWKAGFFTVVHFPLEHVTILWDQRTTIHIQTGPQWQVSRNQNTLMQFIQTLS